MNKLTAWLLTALILLGVGVRLYQINAPDITDFHAWRQADTAAFTRGFLVDTLNPFYPSVDRYPCHYRGEPFGRAEAEFPVVAWVAALPLAAMGVDFPPAPYLRAISIFFFALTCIYLFLLVLRLDDDPPAALLAVLALALLPLAIFFTRTIQPDGPSLFFATGFLYHLLRWVEEDAPKHGALSCLFGALAMLIKISNGYLLFPAVFLFISRRTLWGALKTPKYWAWGTLLLLPAAAWYFHAHQFAWSFGIWGGSGPSKFATAALLTSPGTWRTLSSRMVFDILTWSGVVLLVVGLTQFRQRPSVRLGAAWAGGFALFVCAALQGNITHVYYQLPIVLPASILIGVGIRVLWEQQVAGKLVLLGLAGIYLATASHILIGPSGRWQQGYFGADVSPALKEATRLVRENLAPGEKFVSTERHPAIFFNSRHRGWFYEGDDTLGFIGCAGPDASTILWDNADRETAQATLERHPALKKRVQEVERGEHFSLWRVNDWHAPERHLAAVGGSRGGRSFEWDCPAHAGLQGFMATPGAKPDTINALQPVCAPLSDAAKVESEAPIFGEASKDATPHPLRCAPNTWVVGLKTESRGVIEDLELVCAKLDAPSAAETTPETANRCPAGQIAQGIYGRQGRSIDAIGLRCAGVE